VIFAPITLCLILVIFSVILENSGAGGTHG
jgi:hypothetical protein